MEKKKLVLKKQVIAELSEKQIANVMGGQGNINTIVTGPPPATDRDTCLCDTQIACDTEVCTLGC
ncbi:class I lanthipeptide [Pedobacter jeongneungensis]|uniref:class I lanthipeptide n=1 Tax=Pedobacter jeongneungensis TaxID=947309 RepID=UPI0004684B78|nr:class I lanthipeptide [Pedobacter jeongneungensis]